MPITHAHAPLSCPTLLRAAGAAQAKPTVQVVGMLQQSEQPSAVIPDNVPDNLEFHWIDVPTLVRVMLLFLCNLTLCSTGDLRFGSVHLRRRSPCLKEVRMLEGD